MYVYAKKKQKWVTKLYCG